MISQMPFPSMVAILRWFKPQFLLPALLCLAPFLQAKEQCAQACLAGDCQDGQGAMQYQNCDRYQGEFQAGLRHGNGKYLYQSGDSFSGIYVRDIKEGPGRYTFKDGNSLQGSFKAGTLSGVVILTRKNGLQKTGTWNGSQFVENKQEAGENKKENNTPGEKIASEGAKKEDGRTYMLVLFSGEDSIVVRKGLPIRGEAGMQLFPGDSIKSHEKQAELQARGGVSVKLRKFSEIKIAEDIHTSNTLFLIRGSALIKFNNDRPQSKLHIQVRNQSVNVKGTTFEISADENGNIQEVRVFEGKVSVSSVLPGLDRLKAEDLSANPDLKELKELLKKNEIELESGEKLKPSGDYLNKLNEIVTVLARIPEEALLRISHDELQAPLKNLKEATSNEKGEFEINPRDEAELKIFVELPPAEFEKAMEGQVDKASIEKAFETQLSKKAEAIEQDLSGKSLTKKELIEKYEFIEVLTLNSGEKQAGSVVAQAGDLLILHTEAGVFKLRISDIAYIDIVEELTPGELEQSQPRP